ncbi:hypothetical protein OPQ81_003922 [Rhizoctonia solani]|nr:hypothetical protein OPQ81_003922 [Rhizoctonia solani]
MKTFARLLSFVTLLLSVGFLAQALPTTSTGNGVAVRDYHAPGGYNGGSGHSGNPDYTPSPKADPAPAPAGKEGDHDPKNSVDLLALVTKLNVDVAPLCKELEVAADVTVAAAVVAKIVVLIKALVAVCVNVKLDLDVDVKTAIAVQIVACISLIVKALAAVSVKLGVTVCLALFAQIDVCLQLLLVTLNVCVDGLLDIVISLCANLDIHVLAAIKLLDLELLIKICALVKVIANISI